MDSELEYFKISNKVLDDFDSLMQMHLDKVKHLIWVPSIPHEIGKIVNFDSIRNDKKVRKLYKKNI